MLGRRRRAALARRLQAFVLSLRHRAVLARRLQAVGLNRC